MFSLSLDLKVFLRLFRNMFSIKSYSIYPSLILIVYRHYNIVWPLGVSKNREKKKIFDGKIFMRISACTHAHEE